MIHESCDVLVIGSGIAGLSFALKAAEHGTVVVVTKKERVASSTNYAQGGIAAVISEDDSLRLHARDTYVAGAGLCHTSAVESLVREGPSRVRELMEWGVRFTYEQNMLSLGREGGHSRRRILHAGDLTGREIERALVAAIAADERIRLFEDYLAVDLTVAGEGPERRCTGALVFDHARGELLQFDARAVLLASGGLGQAYQHTTNPEIATGDGVAMAYRAGVEIANLEFVQFHPTALYPAGQRAFLISEAVRGEGAILLDYEGAPLMERVHALASLAPRDVVARTIDAMMKASGAPHAWLDLSPIPPERIETRFPGIMEECAARGLDIRWHPVPVVPAAHYACGGVRTDTNGRTSLPALFAAGEVASTGVHGANRLASNSLLEAVVYSHRAAAALPATLERAGPRTNGPVEAAAPVFAPVSAERWTRAREDVRDVMWQDVGLVRSDERLERAAARIADLQAAYAADAFVADANALEVRNLLDVAGIIVACARRRKESRGLHYNTDYPYRDNEKHLRDTLYVRAVE